MRGQAGFFEVDERRKHLSAEGDSLQRLAQVIDFALFRADLKRAVPRSDRVKSLSWPEQGVGGRHSIAC
jgi:hypothetical protein